jgi:hypothetical protein
MQPQSDKSMVDRFLEWWRGLWGQSGGDAGSTARDRTTDHSTPSDEAQQATRNDVPEESPGAQSVATSPQDGGKAASTITSDDVAPTGSEAVGVAGSTGASYDEFSTGGYVPDAIDQKDIDSAADPGAKRSSSSTAGPGPDATGNDVAGGPPIAGLADSPTSDDQHRENADAVADAIQDETSDAGIDITESTGPRGESSVVDAGLSDEAEGLVSDFIPDADDATEAEAFKVTAGGDPGTDSSGTVSAGDSNLVGEDDDEVRGIGDLRADELGSLEELEDEAVAFRSEMSESFDENSTPVSDAESDSVENIGYEAENYTSAANQDLGMRTVGEDTAGLTDHESSISTSSDDILANAPGDQGQVDTDDARPLSDFTQEQSGFASAADDLTGSDDEPNVGTGLFGTSDIDTTDLSYLDEADNSRFDFPESSDEQASMPSASGTSAASTGTVADDIGASPTGVTDVAGKAVVADADVERPRPARESGDVNVATAQGVAPGVTTTSRSDATGPGGSIRGDASGSCPDDYPIKGNSSSKIYHSPGLASYRGTKAEWCFATEDDARSAGFRAPGARNAGGKTGAGPTTASRTQPPTVANQAGTETAGLNRIAGEENILPETGSLGRESDVPPGALVESAGEFGSGADDIESLERQPPDDLAFIQSQGSTVANEPQTSAEVSAVLDTEAVTDEGGQIYAGAVRGDGTKVCPEDYPIKGNAGSMIYHAPGRASYEGTIAEWCFATEQDAISAGFRAPKR